MIKMSKRGNILRGLIVALIANIGAFACVVAICAALGALASQSAYAAIEDQNIVDPTQRADNSFVYDTTVASLYSQASLYDNRTVQVVGEVIGDRINANNNLYWITLTETVASDKSTISVLLSRDQSDQIDHYGRYGVIGTTFQVRGTYHQACDEHDGLPDIHATTSSVLARGRDVPDAIDPMQLMIGIATVIVGAALMVVFYLARERTR